MFAGIIAAALDPVGIGDIDKYFRVAMKVSYSLQLYFCTRNMIMVLGNIMSRTALIINKLVQLFSHNLPDKPFTASNCCSLLIPANLAPSAWQAGMGIIAVSSCQRVELVERAVNSKIVRRNHSVRVRASARQGLWWNYTSVLAHIFDLGRACNRL